ncbi:MAG: hypothetical protein E7261_11755 [Lachnospiraceae bacterium]|nr:hypothetical protein [Lachnospiraceae bacterium]
MNKLTKKLLPLFLSFILVLFTLQPVQAKTFSLSSSCDEVIVSESTRILDNGMILSIVITESTTPISRIPTYTRSGSKYYLLRDSDGAEVWRFTVTGVFTVTTGVGATCTSATYSTSISDDAWKVDSASAYASGNQAIGNATFVRKVLFITTETMDCDVTLTCDANGTLS